MPDSLFLGALLTLYMSKISVVFAFVYHLAPQKKGAWGLVLRRMITTNTCWFLFSQISGVLALMVFTYRIRQGNYSRTAEFLFCLMALGFLELCLSHFYWTGQENKVITAIRRLLILLRGK